MTHHGGTQTSTRTSIYQHAHDLPFTISRGRHSRTSSVQLLFSSRYSSNPRVGDVVLEPPLPMLVQFINVGALLDDIIRRGTWLEGDALVHEGLLLGRARVTHMPTTVTLSFSDQSTHSNGSKRRPLEQQVSSQVKPSSDTLTGPYSFLKSRCCR